MIEDYFYTRIWAAPASLGLFALMGLFFGIQKEKILLPLRWKINFLKESKRNEIRTSLIW